MFSGLVSCCPILLTRLHLQVAVVIVSGCRHLLWWLGRSQVQARVPWWEVGGVYWFVFPGLAHPSTCRVGWCSRAGEGAFCGDWAPAWS